MLTLAPASACGGRESTRPAAPTPWVESATSPTGAPNPTLSRRLGETRVLLERGPDGVVTVSLEKGDPAECAVAMRASDDGVRSTLVDVRAALISRIDSYAGLCSGDEKALKSVADGLDAAWARFDRAIARGQR